MWASLGFKKLSKQFLGTNIHLHVVFQIAMSVDRHSSRSLDTFKKHLKTHYFKEHFYGI